MRLIDATAYSAEMKQRQEACKEWLAGLEESELQNRAIGTLNGFTEAKLALDSMPTVDAVPVRHGKWLKAYGDHEAFGIRPFYRYCSCCNEATVFPYNYCPHCGARMVEDE